MIELAAAGKSRRRFATAGTTAAADGRALRGEIDAAAMGPRLPDAAAWIASSIGIELTAAIFIGIVAADVFITVMLRYFGIAIPDSYDFGQLLLGILIFWGIAATSYRGTHITVDLVWANVGPR